MVFALNKTKLHKMDWKKIPYDQIFIFVFLIVIIILLLVLIGQNKEEKRGMIKNPFNIQVSDTDNFVFLGDSITDFYPLEEFYDNLPVVNSGVSGYKTTDILSRIDSMVTIYNPTKVFLLIGTNDVPSRSEDEIVKNIQEIVKEIQSKRPKAKIYLESILPVNRSNDDKIDHGMVGERENDKIQSINKKLKQYAEKEKITFINLYDEFVDENNEMTLKYTTEGLHLSSLGYLRLTNILLPYLQD